MKRTGNVTTVTVALNMMCHGGQDWISLIIMEIREAYENFTGMKVHERVPMREIWYLPHFQVSHQDAISKGMAWQKEGKTGKRWIFPYLPIDPADVGKRVRIRCYPYQQRIR